MPSIYPYALSIFTFQSSGAAWNANTSVQATSNFDNRPGSITTGTPASGMMLELLVGFTVAPAAYSDIGIWMAPFIDGSNATSYSLGGNTFQPNTFKGRFSAPLGQTAPQRLSIEYVPLQPLLYTVLMFNYTGQQIAAGWGLRALPIAFQFG